MLVLRYTILFLILFISPAYSKDVPTRSSIQKQAADYFAQNQYNEFVAELSNIKETDKNVIGCIDYYKALSRYNQLKYLEEKQLWDDYFANGNTYREQIVENAKKALSQAQSNDPLKPKSLLLLWKFHSGQQDAFVEQSLTELMDSLDVYAKESSDPELIKEIAAELSLLDEKSNSRQAYKLYVDKVTSGDISDAQLKKIAAGFYKDGNLELAESVFDIYLDRILKSAVPESDKLAQELFETASLFVYKKQGLFDMAYAEKIYEMIDSLGKKDVFNQETIYLRAYNLEKLREYKKASELYLKLTQEYPDTKYYDEAVYKIAMINLYALSNIQEGKKYFEILIGKTDFSSHAISGFYQLGLLAQWEGSLEKAKSHYEELIKNSKDNYSLLTSEANERLKEINENRELSYNLKTFLDLSLKTDAVLAESGKAELKSSAYILSKDEKVDISALVAMPQSGCNQVQLQYLWSGDLAGLSPSTEQSNFQASYADIGTKVINVVIISPAGILDHSFIMLDVY